MIQSHIIKLKNWTEENSFQAIEPDPLTALEK